VKEDVLEQIVDDYLKFKGYLTTHNVRFRPSPDHPDYDSSLDSVRSDVDVVGVDPRRTDLERVVVVSCKSWQEGFDATRRLAMLRGEKPDLTRASWKTFRELWVPKWSQAFRTKIAEITGASAFSYRIAVTRLHGDAQAWADDETITPTCPSAQSGANLSPDGRCFIGLAGQRVPQLARRSSTD
jgi:hypothetical protein